MIYLRVIVLCTSSLLLFVYIALEQRQEDSLLKRAGVRTRNRLPIHEQRTNGTAATILNLTQAPNANEKKNKPQDCSNACLEQHEEQGQGNLLSLTVLHRLVTSEREKLETKLKQEYGNEHFHRIFYNGTTPRGRTVFKSASGDIDGLSIQRFKRMLKLKVLGMQQHAETKVKCNCDQESLQQVRQLTHEQQSQPESPYYEKVVWATGGHSAAAGHGNLFNESYTAVLEDSVKSVFGSVGIEFVGRNHAMGGTSSGPEIALCLDQVFGTDVDILTYDYAMCDAGREQKKALYDQRVGLTGAALLNINILAVDFSQQRKMLQHEEERGMTVLYLDPIEFREMKESFPDTFGLNTSEIDTMPPFVRHFKCRDFIEKGDPTCGDMKYDQDEVCPDRNGRADWHPGWKMHALWGNTFALFLTEMLVEAISELTSVPALNRTSLFNQLKSQKASDYRNFTESAMAKDSTKYEMVPRDIELLNELTNASVFFTEPSVCHTARLPSQQRYLGILTETKETGVSDYFKGISMAEARNISSEVNSEIQMPLVYVESERQTCEVELNRDYKDFFYSSSNMGWTTLTFPNGEEKRAYMKENQKLRGIIVVCLGSCDWGKCEAGDMRKEALFDGRPLLQVNGQPVTNATDLIEDCMVLRGKQGHYWQPNDSGQYIIKSRVSLIANNTTLATLRISSVILL